MNWLFDWLSQYGYVGLFSLLVLGIVGVPVPDETLLVFCGYLIWRGHLKPDLTFLSGFGGSICGISLSYFIGRKYGRRFVHRYGRYLHITPARLHRVTRWFHRIGIWVLTVGYFIPGVRHFTALVAGMSEVSYLRFAVFAYLGAAIWVSSFLALGYFVGERWEHTSATVHKWILIVSLCGGAVLGIWWWLRKRSLDSKRLHGVDRSGPESRDQRGRQSGDAE